MSIIMLGANLVYRKPDIWTSISISLLIILIIKINKKGAKMLKKTDLILLLTDLQSNGIDVTKQLNQLINSSEIPLSVVKFINDNRPLEVTEFYTKLRQNYNHKKSNLYINI